MFTCDSLAQLYANYKTLIFTVVETVLKEEHRIEGVLLKVDRFPEKRKATNDEVCFLNILYIPGRSRTTLGLVGLSHNHLYLQVDLRDNFASTFHFFGDGPGAFTY